MILTEKDIDALGLASATKADVQCIESALLEKLRGGVELPDKFSHPDLIGGIVWTDMELRWIHQYGDARALAGQQRESCTWTEQDDKDMPGTYESSCGEMWSFIEGGLKENRVTYCHHCGGKVVPASPQEQT